MTGHHMSLTDGEDVWLDADAPMTADIERAHVKQGYLDGLSAAQAASLQRGFDAAYPTGAALGLDVGRILARAVCTRDAAVLADASRDLAIARVLARLYFDPDLELAAAHPLIEAWKHRVDAWPGSVSGL